MKHTPGPWQVGNRHPCRIIANNGGAYDLIGTTCEIDDEGTEYEHQVANARLIAAAPELLASLKFMLAGAEAEPSMAIYKAHIEQARAAILKAEGRE